jgi:GTP:adenosylcobinamide-phosphate guanylyltransferase
MTVEQVDKQAAGSLDIGLVLVGPHPKLSGVMVYETKMQQFQRQENRGVNPPNPRYFYFSNGRLMSTEAVIQQAAAITPSSAPTPRPTPSPSSNTQVQRSATTVSPPAIAQIPTTNPPVSPSSNALIPPTPNNNNVRLAEINAIVDKDVERMKQDGSSPRWVQEQKLEFARQQDRGYVRDVEGALTNCSTNGSGPLRVVATDRYFQAPDPTKDTVDTYTLLKITPDKVGELSVIEVQKSSGNTDFDDAAKRRMEVCLPAVKKDPRWTRRKAEEYANVFKNAEKLEVLAFMYSSYTRRNEKHLLP